MKLCRDCIYFEDTKVYGNSLLHVHIAEAKCTYSDNIIDSLVTGVEEQIYTPQQLRADDMVSKLCGAKGSWFVAIEKEGDDD